MDRRRFDHNRNVIGVSEKARDGDYGTTPVSTWYEDGPATTARLPRRRRLSTAIMALFTNITWLVALLAASANAAAAAYTTGKCPFLLRLSYSLACGKHYRNFTYFQLWHFRFGICIPILISSLVHKGYLTPSRADLNLLSFSFAKFTIPPFECTSRFKNILLNCFILYLGRAILFFTKVWTIRNI